MTITEIRFEMKHIAGLGDVARGKQPELSVDDTYESLWNKF